MATARQGSCTRIAIGPERDRVFDVPRGVDVLGEDTRVTGVARIEAHALTIRDAIHRTRDNAPSPYTTMSVPCWRGWS